MSGIPTIGERKYIILRYTDTKYVVGWGWTHLPEGTFMSICETKSLVNARLVMEALARMEEMNGRQ